jgi:hypothetical protein
MVLQWVTDEALETELLFHRPSATSWRSSTKATAASCGRAPVSC